MTPITGFIGKEQSVSIPEVSSQCLRFAQDISEIENLTQEYRLAVSELRMTAQLMLESRIVLEELRDDRSEVAAAYKEWEELTEKSKDIEKRLFGEF